MEEAHEGRDQSDQTDAGKYPTNDSSSTEQKCDAFKGYFIQLFQNFSFLRVIYPCMSMSRLHSETSMQKVT